MQDLDAIGRRQYGLVTRRQLLDVGQSPQMIARWLTAGRITLVQPRVYRLAGAPTTWDSELLAACLSSAGLATHAAGARLWDMYDGDDLHVSIEHCRRARLRGVVVHRSGDLPGCRVLLRRRIPTTTPMRALVDLGAVASPEVVAEALERALVARLFTVASAERALAQVGRPGRSGAGVLRCVLDERALKGAAPDSLLEPRMARVLRKHGLPLAEFQYDVYSDGGVWLARVDFAYPEVKLAIEVDGWSSRATPDDFAYDLERQNRLVLAGWTVIRFPWRKVVLRPNEVAQAIAAALGAEFVA